MRDYTYLATSEKHKERVITMEKNIIVNALKKLGENSTNIKMRISHGLAVVYVNNKYFGIYDFRRETFVD